MLSPSLVWNQKFALCPYLPLRQMGIESLNDSLNAVKLDNDEMEAEILSLGPVIFFTRTVKFYFIQVCIFYNFGCKTNEVINKWCDLVIIKFIL